jgi:DNA-directed RNA polymerase specialized sigma24 family protein
MNQNATQEINADHLRIIEEEMRRYAERRGLDQEKADEVVRSSLESLQKVLDDPEREVRDLKAYGITIVRNAISRSYRAEAKSRTELGNQNSASSVNGTRSAESSHPIEPAVSLSELEQRYFREQLSNGRPAAEVAEEFRRCLIQAAEALESNNGHQPAHEQPTGREQDLLELDLDGHSR